jgi:hypothetical protein
MIITTHHKATSITNQKHGRPSVLARFRQPPQHILRRPVRLPLRILLKQCLHHGRDNVPGRDGVDADVVLAPLGREVARELYDACFGCVVGGAYQTLIRIPLISDVLCHMFYAG